MTFEKSDNELMEEFRGCSVSAFNEIDSRYRRRLFNYILRCFALPRDDGEEVVQLTLIRVWKWKLTYKPTHEFSTWIFIIARNLGLNKIKENRRKAQVDPGDINAIPTPGVSTETENQITAERALALLGRKDPFLRELVVLRYHQDLGYEEIARVTGRKVNTLKSLMKRALEYLRDQLGE